MEPDLEARLTQLCAFFAGEVAARSSKRAPNSPHDPTCDAERSSEASARAASILSCDTLQTDFKISADVSEPFCRDGSSSNDRWSTACDELNALSYVPFHCWKVFLLKEISIAANIFLHCVQTSPGERSFADYQLELSTAPYQTVIVIELFTNSISL